MRQFDREIIQSFVKDLQYMNKRLAVLFVLFFLGIFFELRPNG